MMLPITFISIWHETICLPQRTHIAGIVIVDRSQTIHASKDTRFNYMTNRGRSDDPQDKSKFTERDTKEISVGISRSIALADESISNNNLTIDELVKAACSVIDSWRQ